MAHLKPRSQENYRTYRNRILEFFKEETLVTKKMVTLTQSDNIQYALRLISSKSISHLPVVRERDSRELLGTLREKDVLVAYDKAVCNVRLNWNKLDWFFDFSANAPSDTLDFYR